ncbi:type VII secretion system-associated protein [Amycolatopsis sp. NPDC058986]|uniref:type VII secretion system-associated protein n=1 Tax=unclassified Amycolatopsis TaxID=2618356 RepID=UPI00367140F1
MNEIRDQWVFLVDPGRPAAGSVPPHAVVGAWLTGADGYRGEFLPNPDYDPASAASPTDPVDAALRITGELDAAALLAVIRAGTYGVALDGDGRPVVAPAPDGVPSLLVTTAAEHRARVRTGRWRVLGADELVALLAELGVDVLVNPGARHSMRLARTALSW